MSRVVMCEVRSREKTTKNKPKKTVYSGYNEKEWTVMNPIWCQMKKCSSSSGQNGQMMHWWLLVHFNVSCNLPLVVLLFGCFLVVTGIEHTSGVSKKNCLLHNNTTKMTIQNSQIGHASNSVIQFLDLRVK